jgi:Leucine-rich repeat (LRR) protein
MFSSCEDKDSKVIIEIPDAKFKTYLLENFDTNKDGNISLSEAKKIVEINCSGLGIEALDGIEKFSGLKSLDCSGNNLEDLEVRYNTKLEKLVCNNNTKDPFTIYVGMKSPLKNPVIKKPGKGEQPDASLAANILDPGKVTFDREKTRVYLSYDD